MSAKKDVQTRAAVIAAGEQIHSRTSDLSRARARREFATLASAGEVEEPYASRPHAMSPRAIWTGVAAALSLAAVAALALRMPSSERSSATTAQVSVPAPQTPPRTPVQLTAERVDTHSRRALSLGESVRAEHVESTHIRFSDGTDVALLGGAKLRVASLAPEGAEVHVETGSVSAAVVHQSARTAWDFVAGPFRVHVVGTAFDLGWEPTAGRMQLAMRDGVVRVEGCGVAAREVRAPEGLQLACAEAPHHALVEARGAPGAAPSAMQSPVPAMGTERAASLEALLAAGDWESAYARIAPDLDTRILHASPDEALHLGDIARLAKHAPEAERCYRAAADRGHLALAWLEIAKLQLRRGETAGAREGADKAVANATGSVAEDAHMLGVEAALTEHDDVDARARAQAYLLAFPRGSHADQVRKLIDANSAAGPQAPALPPP